MALRLLKRYARVDLSHSVATYDCVTQEVVGSAFVTAQYLVETGLSAGDTVYVVGEAGLHDELRAVGLLTLVQ